MGPPGVVSTQHSKTKTVDDHIDDCKSNYFITIWCEYTIKSDIEEVLGLTLFLCLIGSLVVFGWEGLNASLLNASIFKQEKFIRVFKCSFKKWWLCFALCLFCLMQFIYQISLKQYWLHCSLCSFENHWLVLERWQIIKKKVYPAKCLGTQKFRQKPMK